MADGYIIPLPIRKTVIKDSVIDFRGWRNKEGVGTSYVDFTGADIVSSLINCQDFFSSTVELSISPVELYFNDLVLDRTNILMSNLSLSSSGSFKLDFYNQFSEARRPSTFRNSILNLTGLDVNERSKITIIADRCNWDKSSLLLNNLIVTATAAEAGGETTFIINTDAEYGAFDLRNATIYNDEFGNGNSIVFNGNYHNSTVNLSYSSFTRGEIEGFFAVTGNLVFSGVNISDQAITNYDVYFSNIDLSHSNITLQNFSNGTTAGTIIHGSQIQLENSTLRVNELVNNPLLNIEDVKIVNSSPLTIEDSNIPMPFVRAFYNYTSINNLVSIKVNSYANVQDKRVNLLTRTLPSGFVANKIAYGLNLDSYSGVGNNDIYLANVDSVSTNVIVNVTGAFLTNIEIPSVDLTGVIIPDETVISFSYMYGVKNYWVGIPATVTYTGGNTVITLYGSTYAEASNGETLTTGVKIHVKNQSGFSYLSGEEPTSLAKYLLGSSAELAFASDGSDASGFVDLILSGLFIA